MARSASTSASSRSGARAPRRRPDRGCDAGARAAVLADAQRHDAKRALDALEPEDARREVALEPLGLGLLGGEPRERLGGLGELERRRRRACGRGGAVDRERLAQHAGRRRAPRPARAWRGPRADAVEGLSPRVARRASRAAARTRPRAVRAGAAATQREPQAQREEDGDAPCRELATGSGATGGGGAITPSSSIPPRSVLASSLCVRSRSCASAASRGTRHGESTPAAAQAARLAGGRQHVLVRRAARRRAGRPPGDRRASHAASNELRRPRSSRGRARPRAPGIERERRDPVERERRRHQRYP